MKKLILAAFLAATTLCAQNPNPQPSYVQTMSLLHPSTWLRFNGASGTSFTDAITGLIFHNNVASGQLPTTGIVATGAGYAQFNVDALVGGNLASVTVQTYGICTGPEVILIGTNSGSTGSPVITITDSFTVTLASSSSPQTFVSGTDYTPRTAAAGQLIGFYQPPSATCLLSQGNGSGTYGNYYLPSSTQPTGAQVYTTGAPIYTSSLQAQISVGTVTPLQPGFDAQQKNNFSAAFSYNSLASAPNSSIGSYEWSTPSTLYIHINKLNYARNQPLVLLSKGDTNPSDFQPYWELMIQMTNNASQLCFIAQGPSPGIGGANVSILTMCTGVGFDAMPNGFNYDIAVVNTGGGWTSDYTLWINGIDVGGNLPVSDVAQFNNGFDPVVTTITNGGTGYASSTAFTSTGGGPNCVYTGTVLASGGVINGINRTRASGCTSAPTIVLTAPTGTGATFSNTAIVSTNLNSLPVMVGNTSGMSTDTTQAAVDVDEVAIFPVALTPAQVTNLYYWTQLYQGIVGAPPAAPPLLFIDEDSNDADNQFMISAAIGMDVRNYLRLQGLIESDGDQICQQMWRQMLNQAGLNHIPLGTSASSATTSTCFTSDINTYNASTPIPAFNSSTAIYRKVFAANPTRKIDVILAGYFTGMAAFMQSGADSISPLTGQQLLDRNAANGGAIFGQGLGCTPATNFVPIPCSATATFDNSLGDPVAGQYVVSHNGATPIYFYGGIPSSTGPGAQWGRTAKDPIFLYGTSHTFVRQAFDSLALAGTQTPIFSRGMFLTVTGGTGYANLTPFTSTGGGATCNVSGFMVASSGVPTGFATQWQTAQDTFSGIGYGCTSTPTINLVGATGTGASITVAPTAVCGTVTITTGGTPTASVSSATCSNHYFLPYGSLAGGAALPVFSMYLNSFIDPPPTGQPRVPN